MSLPEPPPRVVGWLPSPIGIHVLVLSGLLVAFVLAKGPWDADFFWHFRTGELIATTGLFGTDPFSFTWNGRPWVLHEWLSQLAIYQLVDAFGYLGAVAVFAILPGLAYAILAFGLARTGARPSAVIAGTALSALVMVPYLTIRPQVVSWVFFAVLVVALLLVRPLQAPWLLLAGPFFALWANLHGLWVVALGVVGVYVILTLLGRTPMAAARWWVVGAMAAAVASSAITPAGIEGMLYPLRYVEAGDWGLANIVEWQSPDFHDPAHLPLLTFIVALVGVGRRNVPAWMTAFAILGVVLALLALRNAPVAAIIGLPALVTGLSATLDESRPRSIVRSRRTATGRRLLELATGTVVLVAGLVLFVPRDPAAAVQATMEEHLPVQSTALLQSVRPDARVVAEYGWAGYIIGTLFPSGGSVMIDGRNDMYPQAILEEYEAIRDADPGWEALADQYGVDALLFPPERAIGKGPAVGAGWCEAHRDENEVLYLRSCP